MLSYDNSQPAVDESQLNELKMIMEDEFDGLLSIYISDGQVQIDEISSGIGSGDSEAVRKSAHTLKGSSANISAMLLSSLCSGLEALAKSGSLDGASDHLDTIQQEFNRVKNALENL